MVCRALAVQDILIRENILVRLFYWPIRASRRRPHFRMGKDGPSSMARLSQVILGAGALLHGEFLTYQVFLRVGADFH